VFDEKLRGRLKVVENPLLVGQHSGLVPRLAVLASDEIKSNKNTAQTRSTSAMYSERKHGLGAHKLFSLSEITAPGT